MARIFYSAPREQAQYKQVHLNTIARKNPGAALDRMKESYHKAQHPDDINFLDRTLVESVPAIRRHRNGGYDLALKVAMGVGDSKAWPQRKNVPVAAALKDDIKTICVSVLNKSLDDNIFPARLEESGDTLDRLTTKLPAKKVNDRNKGADAFLKVAHGWAHLPLTMRKKAALERKPKPATYHLEQAALSVQKACALTKDKTRLAQAQQTYLDIVDAALHMPENREAGLAFANNLAQQLGTESPAGTAVNQVVTAFRASHRIIGQPVFSDPQAPLPSSYLDGSKPERRIAYPSNELSGKKLVREVF